VWTPAAQILLPNNLRLILDLSNRIGTGGAPAGHPAHSSCFDGLLDH
jgi:hypothetical protein